MKWGKITNEEWNLKQVSWDPDAQAVVLGEYGKKEILYSSIRTLIHRKIKLLDDGAVSAADIQLDYYGYDNLEDIRNLKAQVHFIDAYGKKNSIKLSKKDFFETDINDYWRAIKFTFPKAETGAILEYSYEKVSRNYSFPDGWVFHNFYPTRYSGFELVIERGLTYRFLLQGVELLQKYHSDISGKWELKNTPAMKDEPFAPNPLDYVNRLRLQLKSYFKHSQNPGIEQSETVQTMSNWRTIANEYMTSSTVSGYYTRGGKCRDILEEVLNGGESDLDKAVKIYDYVRTHLHWNGYYSRYPDVSFMDIYRGEPGTTAALNLFMVALMDEAGLVASPVLNSTISKGKTLEDFAFMDQFNNIIANVFIGRKAYQLDATDPGRPFGLLPLTAITDRGYLLDKENPKWIDIANTIPTNSAHSAKLVFQDGAPEVAIQSSYLGYDALAFLKNHKEKELKANGLWASEGLSIQDVQIQSPTHFDEPLKVQLDGSVSDEFQEKIYLEPVLIRPFSENPFKEEKRLTPVLFPSPIFYTYMVTIELPEGTRVVDLPQNALNVLPEKLGEFRFQCVHSGNKIHVTTQVKFGKREVPLRYYGALREMFNIILAKMSEPVVLDAS